MKKWTVCALATVLVLCVALTVPFGAEAEEVVYGTSGDFEYSLENGEITIEGVIDSFSGHAEIPETIEGYPVTKIGEFAFGSEKGTTYFTTSVTIPDSVTEIGDYAFSDCWGLTTVNMGNGVVSVGSEAFYNCINLTSITLGDNVDAIHSQAFYGCENLSSVTLNNKLQLISWSAFEGCTSLTEIVFPGSVTNISDRAFANCVGLKDVIIPANVVQMGKGVFAGCKCIVKVDENNEFYSSDDYGVLYNKSKSELIMASSAVEAQYTIPETVTQIGASAFEGCAQLTEVTIPNTVTDIGDSAFKSCNGLTSITIPQSITEIQASTFQWCSGLTSVTFSQSAVATRSTAVSGLTGIGDNAFYGCTGLTEITIPDTVTQIGQYAFASCSSLVSISFPDSLSFVGQSAFYACDSLAYTEYDNAKYLGNANNPYVILLECTASDITSCQIPEGTRVIYDSAFYDCSSMTEIALPEGIACIGRYAFYGCKGLTEIVIPDSVISVGEWAFGYCSGLTSVTVGSGVSYIGDNAFYECNGLLNTGIVHISDMAAWCAIDFADKDANPAYGSNLYLDGKLITALVIPDGVTRIGNYAFYCCDDFTALDLPDSLTEIGGFAFSDYHLEHITYAGDEERWQQTLGQTFTGTTIHYETRLTQHSQCALTGLYCPVCAKFITSEKIEGASHVYTDSTDISCNNCDFVQSITYAYMKQYPQKLTYTWLYDTLDVTGGTLTTLYDEGAGILVPVTEDMVTGFDNTVLGKQTLTITFAEWTFSYTVYVEPGTPDRIEIVSLPSKLNYMPGESLDLSGLETVAYYGENTYSIGTSEYTVVNSDTGTPGDNTVELDFNGVTVSFTIHVYGITGLQIDTLPQKVDYLVDEELDLTGLTVSAVYENGSEEALPYYRMDVSGVDMSTTGKKTVTLTCTYYENTYQVSFDIRVLAVVSLQIDSLPQRLSYIIGSTLDLTGLAVSAQMEDGSLFQVPTADLEITVPDMETETAGAGKQTVTVCYDGVYAYFDVYIHYYFPQQIDTSLYPESSHDYSNYADETKTFTYEGADALILTFNSESMTEQGCDFVYIYDGSGNEIGKYSGDLAYQCVTVPGDTFSIRLTSDYGATYYGYAFAYIDAATVWHEYLDGYCTICGQMQITAGGYVDGSYTEFSTVKAALEAGVPWVKLHDHAFEELSLEADLYIDLNGYSMNGMITTNGYKIYGMDSTTDEYNCDMRGIMSCCDENDALIVPEPYYSGDITGQTKRYLAIDEGGCYSFHRFYLGITNITLNTAQVGLGYKAAFLGDEMVQQQLESFSYTLQLGQFNPVSRTLSSIGDDGLVTLLVKNYMIGQYGETDLSAYVTVTLAGQQISSAVHTTSMRQTVEAINDSYTDYEDAQLTAVKELILANEVMQSWGVENLLREDNSLKAGTAYKFGMINTNNSATTVYYLTGNMRGYYLETTSSISSGIDVYLEETAGGYYLYTWTESGKEYINMVVSGSYVNGAYSTTASTVYTYDSDLQTLVATVNSRTYWFGTRNDKSYTTMGPCYYDAFVSHFYTAEGEMVTDGN